MKMQLGYFLEGYAMHIYSFKARLTYSGGSYEKRATNTQHLPLPGMSSISTCGSPLPLATKP